MRRVTFNLKEFLEDLEICLRENPQNIDDEIERYKTFLSHTNRPLLDNVLTYVNTHPLVTENELVRSYIMSCHSSIL